MLACDSEGSKLGEAQRFTSRRETIAPLEADVTSTRPPATTVDEALNVFGSVDVVVNNAEIGNAGSMVNTADEQWDRILDVNLRSAFRLSRQVLIQLANVRGSIINISSTPGVLGAADNTAYAASKAGLIGLPRQMAADARPLGVHVNSIGPGLVKDRAYTGAVGSAEIHGGQRATHPL